MKVVINYAGCLAAILAAGALLAAPAASAAASVANVSVASTIPAAGATNVCTNAPISATFAVPSGGEMNGNSISMTWPSVASGVELDFETGTVATFTPVTPLTAGVTYAVTVRGGAGGVRDLASPPHTMLADLTWTFTAVDCAVAPAKGAGRRS